MKTKIIIGATAFVLVFVLLLPFILFSGMLTVMVAFLNPSAVSMEQDDVHYQALQAVNAEYQPENNIDVYLIKVIDLFHHDKMMDEQKKIEDFIVTYFLLECTRTLEVEEDGEVVETKEEIYYRYKSFYELVQTVRAAPFNFVDEQISAIVSLSMTGIMLGGSTDEGTSVGGAALFPGEAADGTIGKFPAPVKTGIITCGYGPRVNPISGKNEMHPAIDIQGTWHQKIYSIADGEVITVSTGYSPYGNFVVIKHTLEDGTILYSKYAHMSRIDVKKGDMVTVGQVIGLEGGNPSDPNPGWSTGHHLHFEMYTDQGHLNPVDYIY